MSETSEADARCDAAAVMLGAILNDRLGNQPVDKIWMLVAREILYDHRVKARQAGLDFPELTILAFPRLNTVKFYRADLNREQINRVVIVLAKEMPGLHPDDLAWAVKMGWPHYTPDISSGLVHLHASATRH